MAKPTGTSNLPFVLLWRRTQLSCKGKLILYTLTIIYMI